MKIYTKTGDKGKTSLLGGERVSKTDARIWAYGTVDEANSHLGFAKSLIKDENTKKIIHEVQKDLFEVSAELASLGTKAYKKRINEGYTKKLENAIDEINKKVPPLTSFVVPGETTVSGALDIARVVIRKAERYTYELVDQYEVNEDLLSYLNRLSDYVFMVGRFVELVQNIADDNIES